MIYDRGAEGSRTPDLVNAIHALSQLSYGPIYLSVFKRTKYNKTRLTCQMLLVF